MKTLLLLATLATALNAIGQTTTETINGSACFSGGFCVEVVPSNPQVVTEYYVQPGKSLQVGSKLCIGEPTEICIADRTAEDYGSQVVKGRKYADVWVVPQYTGSDAQVAQLSPTIQVKCVDGVITGKSSKIYQLTPTDTLVLVLNTKGAVVARYLNPSPSLHYPKNAQLLICKAG